MENEKPTLKELQAKTEKSLQSAIAAGGFTYWNFVENKLDNIPAKYLKRK